LAQLSSDALLEGGEGAPSIDWAAASPSHPALTKELLLLATELLHALEHAVPERDGATRDMGQRLQNLAQQAATLGGQPRHQQMQPQGDAENGSAPRRVLQADQPMERSLPSLQHDGSGQMPTVKSASDGRASGWPPLDYDSLKAALASPGHGDGVALLLQALRWRINKTPAGKARRRALHSYIAADLLSCSSDQQTCPLLATSPSPSVVEQWARLVNCAASECCGRTYLLQQEGLVKTLCALLKSEPSDSALRRNVLGALQKFSLRHEPQNQMLEAELIAWIVEALRCADGTDVSEGLSDYSIEYGTALLMNLSLRPAGKRQAETVPTLDVLNSLLEMDNAQVRTYVNGTLYSVLTRPALKEKARAMGMEEILQCAMDHADETFARQIQYILEQLLSDEVEEEADEDEDEGEGEGEGEAEGRVYGEMREPEAEDADELDPEDVVVLATGGRDVVGEAALSHHYL